MFVLEGLNELEMLMDGVNMSRTQRERCLLINPVPARPFAGSQSFRPMLEVERAAM